jgi:hypothetical protein
MSVARRTMHQHCAQNTRRHLSRIKTQLATPQCDVRALLRNQDPETALNRRHGDAQIWRLYDRRRREAWHHGITRGAAALKPSSRLLPRARTCGCRSARLLADACGKVGKAGEGLACLNDAARSIEVTQEHSTEAEFDRIGRELLSLLHDVRAAKASLRTGIAIVRRQKARLFEPQTARSLTYLLFEQEETHRSSRCSHTCLWPVYRRIGSPILKQAKALLDQLR